VTEAAGKARRLGDPTQSYSGKTGWSVERLSP